MIPFFGSLVSRETTASAMPELEAEIVRLFDQMRGRLMRYALSLGIAIPDAEEIVQDVFLALFRHLSSGGSRHSLGGWLFQVTRNLSLKRRAAIATRLTDHFGDDRAAESAQVAHPDPTPEDQIAFQQRQDRLRSVVSALPEMDRECLYLRAEGLRYREIAEVLGISIGSVANSLARSLARLTAADERLG